MESESNNEMTDMQPAQSTTGALLKGQNRSEIEKMAACGMAAHQIAAALELSESDKVLFCRLAAMPGSELAQIIENGRAMGIAQPQFALHKAAGQGNIEAVRALQAFKEKNYFVELLTNMDDDEFTL